MICDIKFRRAFARRRATALKVLNLRGTRITDASLKELMQMKGLTTLAVRETGISEAGQKELREALPKTNFDLAM